MEKTLKSKIVGSCCECGGTGYLDTHELCSCVITLRAYNRMVHGGFQERIIDFVNKVNYEVPEIDSGKEFLDFFVKNQLVCLNKGLSLYIYSKDKGRGKTTLSYYLVFKLLLEFMKTENYHSVESVCSFRHIQDCLRKNEDSFMYSTVLVLDDLGNEDRSATWIREAAIPKLQRMLHYRRDKRLVTLITSNYPPSKISGLYGGELDSLLEIMGSDLGGELFRAVEVGGGEDLRMLPENTEWNLEAAD